MRTKLIKAQHFPNPLHVNSDIVAIGGDLDTIRLIEAYKNGIFPWYNKGEPILWWSPNVRLVLNPSDFKCSKSLKKSIKKFSFTCNENFAKVIALCKELRESGVLGTWITADMQKAYLALHVEGLAKSVECWRDGELVGGLYGVVVGGVFCGESMFSTVSDASKACLWYLCEILRSKGGLIDCQNPTDHLKSLGAKEISKAEFLEILHKKRDEKMCL